jgi:hypothetical protein
MVLGMILPPLMLSEPGMQIAGGFRLEHPDLPRVNGEVQPTGNSCADSGESD